MRLFKAVLAVVIALLCSYLARAGRAAGTPELVVYTYDSIAAKDGLGPILREAFRKKTGGELRFVTAGDAGQLLSRIQLDAEKAKGKKDGALGHVVLGVDQNLLPRLKPFLAPLDRSKDAPFMKFVDREWWLSDAFVPFDFGVMAFVADTRKLEPSDFPKTWSDLTKRRFRKSLLLEDPRTSSPGLGFVVGSAQRAAASVGEDFSAVGTDDTPVKEEKTKKAFAEFWSDLRSQWLTLSPSWSQAYGMFLKGEAPLVWSYVTSQAYHRVKGTEGERDRYRAVVFEDGNPVQIEGAALLAGAPGGAAARKRALAFLELLVSEEIQSRVPETQWMMPVRLGTRLPDAFQALPTVKKRFPADISREKLDALLERWGSAIR